MVDPYFASDRALLKVIGQKIKQKRIAANLSQKELSERSGLSVFSISQTENGNNISLLSLLAILRAMNALNMLWQFFEEEQIDPIAMADYAKKHPQRQRATGTTKQPKLNDKKPESEW